MKRILALAALMTIASCAHVGWDTTKLGSKFKARQYNSLTHKYEARPTFLELTTFKNGSDYLAVFMDEYGSTAAELRFVDEQANEYIALIDKYLEWEKLATVNEDIVDKKIGSAKGFANTINFSFYSGSQYSHFLVLDTLGVNDQFYSRADAIALREVLAEYRDGKIKQNDIDARYQ